MWDQESYNYPALLISSQNVRGTYALWSQPQSGKYSLITFTSKFRPWNTTSSITTFLRTCYISTETLTRSFQLTWVLFHPMVATTHWISPVWWEQKKLVPSQSRQHHQTFLCLSTSHREEHLWATVWDLLHMPKKHSCKCISKDHSNSLKRPLTHSAFNMSDSRDGSPGFNMPTKTGLTVHAWICVNKLEYARISTLRCAWMHRQARAELCDFCSKSNLVLP